MATDIKVVIPTDFDNTIQLGANVAKKFGIVKTELKKLLPETVNNVELNGTNLVITKADGTKQNVDLTPALPNVVADLFLKDVKIVGEELQFVVGQEDDTDGDKTLKVNIADILKDIKVDGVTIKGKATTAAPLQVGISTATGNLLKKDANGLVVNPADIPRKAADVRLVNASGETTVGYLYSTES